MYIEYRQNICVEHDRGGFRGWPKRLRPPLSVHHRFFFGSKFRIMLSFCKQAVGTFDFLAKALFFANSMTKVNKLSTYRR